SAIDHQRLVAGGSEQRDACPERQSLVARSKHRVRITTPIVEEDRAAAEQHQITGSNGRDKRRDVTEWHRLAAVAIQKTFRVAGDDRERRVWTGGAQRSCHPGQNRLVSQVRPAPCRRPSKKNSSHCSGDRIIPSPARESREWTRMV